MSTGNRANLDPSIKLYQHDIRDAALEQVFKDFKPDVVDHHAAQSNVPASLTDPVFDASVNVLGGLNLLKLSAAHGVKKFIYISSGGAMYGQLIEVVRGAWGQEVHLHLVGRGHVRRT